ncbi:MAG: MopE-related protein [Myxococcota bacterium]
MRAIALFAALAACSREDAPEDSEKAATDTAPDGPIDADADGSPADEDCDDGDPSVNPGASEVCNGVDDDCDGVVDDAGDTWYADADGDGFGVEGDALVRCEAPEGYVATAGDCDDGSAEVSPAAVETCNLVDDDCDAAVDEPEARDAAVWYPDADADGFGDPAAGEAACEAPLDFVADAGDCDDADPAVNPEGLEACNGHDDDCDGETDEAGAAGELTWYADGDGDGYGDAAATVLACDVPVGFVADATDCDDVSAAVSPAASEACNDVDDDCDGATDEAGATGEATWYADTDADGFGDAASPALACDLPAGFVADDTDCDDTSAAVSPAAPETCDGIDDDCDGDIDEADAVDAGDWYTDADGDGWGTGFGTDACEAPAGTVAANGDCDDTSAAVSPSAAEVCEDGVDDDCDGTADDGCPTITTHCADISTDTTWSAGVHEVTCDIYVGGSTRPTLTIEDDVEVRFARGAGLWIGTSSYGRLVVEGTSAGVLFTSTEAAPAAGDTDGLVFGQYDRGSVLTGATVEYAGYNGYGAIWLYYNGSTGFDVTLVGSVVRESSVAGIYGTSSAAVDVSSTSIEDNAGHGVYLGSSAQLTGAFSDNVVGGNGGNAVVVPPEAAGRLDGTSTFVGNAVDTALVLAGTVDSDTSWSVLDVPYQVDGDVYVQGSGNPTLTVEDGAVVSFDPSVGLLVGTSSWGKLVVDGHTEGVTFTSSATSPAPGDWDGITIGTYQRGSTLDGATIEYGGGNGYGALWVYNAGSSGYTVTLTDSTVRESDRAGVYGSGTVLLGASGSRFEDNATYGLVLASTAASFSSDASFTDNVVTGNGTYGLGLYPDALRGLDGSSSFAGNGSGGVRVEGGTASTSGTWPALDVAYVVAGDVYVQASTGPIVTIEDGAELQFLASTGLLVATSSYGALVVDGHTVGVAFGSGQTTPARGDWDGLTFGTYDRGSTLDGATVTHGGNNGYGNVWAYYNGSAGYSLAITDSVVSESKYAGVYLTPSASVSVSGTELSGNATYGLHDADTGGAIDGAFADNVVTDNDTYALYLQPNDVGQMDATSTFVGNATDRVYVAAGSMTVSGTMQDLDADWLLGGDVYVQSASSPLLTVDPGTTIRFSSSAGLWVGTSSYGSMAAIGTATEPITFTSDTSASAGAWDGLAFGTYDAGSELVGLDVSYGGGNGYGNVWFYYTSAPSIADSGVSWSSRYGIYRSACSPSVSGITYTGNTSGTIY